VVYDNEYYNNNVADPSNLHLCTWRNAPQHSTADTPLNSVDQFSMSLKYLQRNTEYFFEISAVQYDHQAFTQAELTDPMATDQFGTSRRLMNHDGKPAVARSSVPTAAISQRAAKLAERDAAKSKFAASRKTLSLMLPVSDSLTADAIFPQGKVELSKTSRDGSFGSAGTAGFVIGGPPVGHQLSEAEIQSDMLQHDDNPWEWIKVAFVNGPFTQSWRTFTGMNDDLREKTDIEHLGFMDVLFSGRIFNMDFLFQENRIRASIGLLPWVVILALLLEVLVMNCLTPLALMSRSVKTVGQGFDKRPDHSSAGHISGISRDGRFRVYQRYARSFFDYPGSGVHLGHLCDPQGDCCSTLMKIVNQIVGVIVNECGCILAGSYVYAFYLWALGLVAMCVAVPNHYLGTSRWFRKGFMDMCWYILDYSCVEMFYYCIIAKNLSKVRDDTGAERTRRATRQYILIKDNGICKHLLIWTAMLFVRIAQYSIALVYLPVSLAAAAIYYVYTFFSRLNIWMCFPHQCCFASKEGKTDPFFGHDKTFFDDTKKDFNDMPDAAHVDTHTIWTLLPWEWRGVGYGYLEFGKLRELEDDEEDNKRSNPFASSKFTKSSANRYESRGKVSKQDPEEEKRLFTV
jgi:hypothetical protein